jgi:hypothetical protein
MVIAQEKFHAYLHISMSPTILNHTNDIIDSLAPFIQNYPMIMLPRMSNELKHFQAIRNLVSTTRYRIHVGYDFYQAGGTSFARIMLTRFRWCSVMQISNIKTILILFLNDISLTNLPAFITIKIG